MLLKWLGRGPRVPRPAQLGERFLPFAAFELLHGFNDREMIIM